MQGAATLTRWFIVVIRASIVSTEIRDRPDFVPGIVAGIDPPRVVPGVVGVMQWAVGPVPIRLVTEDLWPVRFKRFATAWTVWWRPRRWRRWTSSPVVRLPLTISPGVGLGRRLI